MALRPDRTREEGKDKYREQKRKQVDREDYEIEEKETRGMARARRKATERGILHKRLPFLTLLTRHGCLCHVVN